MKRLCLDCPNATNKVCYSAGGGFPEQARGWRSDRLPDCLAVWLAGWLAARPAYFCLRATMAIRHHHPSFAISESPLILQLNDRHDDDISITKATSHDAPRKQAGPDHVAAGFFFFSL